MSELPQIVGIEKIVQETPAIKTFYLDCKMNASPGQFVMVWIPRVDEKPFTLTKIGKEIAVTVMLKGKFTEKMHSLKEGDKIGARGPYGNGFSIGKVKNACIVAGGCGAAPVITLAEKLVEGRIPFKTVLGGKTREECLFTERLGKLSDLYITTDDGSEGRKGFTTDVLAELLEKEKFDAVFSCGPEAMMKAVFDLCEEKNIECQLNLERYMKCGFGLCGQCALDGLRVCTDGPVFSSEQLRKSKEFGKTARLKSGKSLGLKDYAEWRQK